MIGKMELAGREWHLDVVDRCPHCHRPASLEVIAVGKSPKLKECGVTFYCRACERLSFADLVLTGLTFGDSSTKLRVSYPDPEQLPLPQGISYVAEAYPVDAEAIMAEPLSKSIARIEYPRINALAKVAAWSGNVEVDMKDFIVALCHLILAEKVGDKAVERVAPS